MQGQIDHNLFITIFWAFFFSSLAVSIVMWVLRSAVNCLSILIRWATGNGVGNRLRSVSSIASANRLRKSKVQDDFVPAEIIVKR